MKARLGLLLGLVSWSSWAAETTVVPAHTFVLDLSYIQSSLTQRFDDQRHALPLIDPILRYEPGGGLQGTLSATPRATYHFIVAQILYGLTDRLTAALYLPMVVQTVIDANFGWVPGDYQGGLGRRYSFDDFWAWAGSLGQPRPPDRWVGNRWTFADLFVGGRYKVPSFSWLKAIGLESAFTLLVALPTGKPADPEQVISAGTTTWDLHAYGDVDVHLAVDRPFFADASGVARVNLGADLFYSFFRPRQMVSATGALNPLLTTYAPYTGATYWLDPGDWLGVTVSLDLVPLLGPTRASLVSGGDLETANALPPLLTVNLSYTYLATAASNWTSDSALWDYDREKQWGPGDKHAFKVGGTVSLLRLGLPLQLYASYRAQDLLHGRNTRATDSFTAGLRVLAKFW